MVGQKQRRNYMQQADTHFAAYIRARDGICMARLYGSECKGNLQCAHIHSRSYKSIRTNPDNAVALCAGHHMYFTHHPIQWRNFVEKMNPGLWEDLAELALRYEPVDWKEEAAYWKAQT